jgi:cobalt-zinc-cadmium efflux system outer membrane protein
LGPDVELSVTEEFIDLLMIPAQKKIAAAKFEQAKLEVAGKVIDLASDVKAAYFTLAGDEQMLELRKTAADAMQLSAQAAQKMNDAGNLNDLDLANELATAEEAKADLASASSQVEVDREKLIELMGIDSSATVQVEGRLAEPGEDLPVEQLGKIAQRKRLDLLAAKQAIVVAARSAKLTDETRLIPDLDVGVDTERNPDGSRVTGPVFQLPIPLFDQGQGTVMRGRAELMQKQQEYLALARKIGSEVREADQKMVAARERARAYHETILPLRQRVVKQAQLHYNGMLLGIFQLLDAKQREIDAGREYISALKDYWVARCAVEKAVGGDFSGMEMQNGATTQQFGG